MFLIVLLLDVALWLLVGLDMGLLGYLLHASGWLGIYTATVVLNNHTYGRVVIPTFGSFIK